MKTNLAVVSVIGASVLGALGQTIEFTFVPPLGTGFYDEVYGKVSGVPPLAYKVAMAINVFDTWWVKPFYSNPNITINTNGVFHSRYATGGQDTCAKQIVCFLVPTNYDIPLFGGVVHIPEELTNNAVAIVSTNRGGLLREFTFSGYRWKTKDTHECIWGPGDNHFTENNVFVDGQGKLHLAITYTNGYWACAEIVMTNSLGYGAYRFHLDTDVVNFPPSIVVGFFTWSDDPDYTHRELDVEFSNGSVIGSPMNWQYAIQPYNAPGHRVRFSQPGPMPASTHAFTWTPAAAYYESYTNHTDNRKVFTVQSAGDLSSEWVNITNVQVSTDSTNMQISVITPQT